MKRSHPSPGFRIETESHGHFVIYFGIVGQNWPTKIKDLTYNPANIVETFLRCSVSNLKVSQMGEGWGFSKLILWLQSQDKTNISGKTDPRDPGSKFCFNLFLSLSFVAFLCCLFNLIYSL